MNILFIGPYRQNDGWGLAAKDYLSCLNQIEGHTVSAAPIYMSNNLDNDIDPELVGIENTYCDKFDVIIQNVLPNYFERHDAYNIGIYYSETKNLNKSVFIEKINLLDELWVSSQSEKETLETSGVTCLISVVPIPFNSNLLDSMSNVKPLDIPITKDAFNFYVVAEYTERKNIEAAVIAFNREFSNDTNVNLILKTRIQQVNDQQNQQKITDDFLKLKSKLRLYNRIELYANEILISRPLTYEQVIALHKMGNCLLVPSRGEAYCKPALEALYFGNQVICTEGIHTCSILQGKCTTAESMEVPIIVNQPPAPHIYTGWETWNEISIIDLQKKMRQAVDMDSPDTSDWVKHNFSYDAIADKIRERLCQL